MKKIYVVGTDSYSGKGGISISTRNLIKGFSKFNIEVKEVVSHSPSSKIRAFINAFVFLANTPCKGQLFWFQLGPWLSLSRKLALICLVKAKGGNVLVQVHSQTFEKYTDSLFLKALYKIIFMLSDFIGFLGGWWSDFANKNYNIPGEKSLIIPNFINPGENLSGGGTPKNIDSINLLAMSRLVEGKGFECLINLLPNLSSHYHLHIAGDGPLKDSLISLVNKNSLQDQVTFHGWVDDQKKLNLFKHSDLFILPSSNDSFGMVFIEAMQSSIPVVALRYKGVCDVVPHLNGGYLCENTSPEELKKGIQVLLTNYDFHALRCKEFVEKNYTPQVIIPNLIQSLKIQ